jgi:hypothetical protein
LLRVEIQRKLIEAGILQKLSNIAEKTEGALRNQDSSRYPLLPVIS